MTRAGRIAIPPTAFRSMRSRKRPRVEERDHRKSVGGLPCCVCGSRKNVEAAHLRMASLQHGKSEAGMGAKPDDAWLTPLCADHHREQHEIGEQKFWQLHGIDPFLLALSLWRATGREEEMETIIRETRNAATGRAPK